MSLLRATGLLGRELHETDSTILQPSGPARSVTFIFKDALARVLDFIRRLVPRQPGSGELRIADWSRELNKRRGNHGSHGGLLRRKGLRSCVSSGAGPLPGSDFAMARGAERPDDRKLTMDESVRCTE